jgi:hypothetical protein
MPTWALYDCAAPALAFVISAMGTMCIAKKAIHGAASWNTSLVNSHDSHRGELSVLM